MQFTQAMNFQQLKAVKDTRMKRMDLRPAEALSHALCHCFLHLEVVRTCLTPFLEGQARVFSSKTGVRGVLGVN